MIVSKRKKRFIFKKVLLSILLVLIVVIIWYINFHRPSKVGDWQEKVAVQSTAQFDGDNVTVKNIRNFQYPKTENAPIVSYYDKTYDLSQISKVWFITEPFKPGALAAHTFLSFEFKNNDFLAITIEARLQKSQKYNIYKGLLHTYPLIYVATDERDAVFLRANVRKTMVYLYPVVASPEQSRILLVDILSKMNDVVQNPAWYNSIWANCTSQIAYHVNKIWPEALSTFSWQLWITGYADELAFKKGLIASDLPVLEAREKYLITEKSQRIGYDSNYSTLIRQ